MPTAVSTYTLAMLAVELNVAQYGGFADWRPDYLRGGFVAGRGFGEAILGRDEAEREISKGWRRVAR